MSRSSTILPTGAIPLAFALSSSVAAAQAQAEAPTSSGAASSLELPSPTLEETPERIPPGLPRSSQGFEAAMRGSFGVPFGSAADGTGMSNLISGLIAAQADFGYRFDPHWFVGLFGSAGVGLKGQACREDDPAPPSQEQNPPVGSRCDAPNDFRLGVLGVLHLLSMTSDVSPWVGLGVGYEWLNIAETLGRRTFVQTFSGLELFDLQAGVDFAVGSRLRVGPFAHFSLGRYTTLGDDPNAEPATARGHALHQWLHFGVKASLGPFGE